MSIIQSPPDIQKIIAEISDPGDLFKKLSTPELQQIVNKANLRYMHWQKFQYIRLPPTISNKEAWAAIKFTRATSLKPLPIKDKNGNQFKYWIPDSMLRALSEIDLLSGGNITTDRASPLPLKEQYIISSLMEEAIASSQLEGAATTREKAKEMLRSGRRPKDISEQMILNNWATMQYIRKSRRSKLTPETLSEIHALVTKETLKTPSEAGQVRTTDDIVVEYNNSVVHIPPKANTLNERINALCRFVNDDDKERWIHPVIKGAMIHFWLAYDHPFTDGNGRTARALMYWYLLSKQYILFEYIAISRYIVKAPGKYVRAYLYTETDDNDLTYFLMYNLRAIRQAIGDLREYLQRKQVEYGKVGDLLKSCRQLNIRQRTLLSHAIRHPGEYYTIEVHKNYHGTVYETARNDLMSLAKQGFLKKDQQGREYLFTPTKKIAEKIKIYARRKADFNVGSKQSQTTLFTEADNQFIA